MSGWFTGESSKSQDDKTIYGEVVTDPDELREKIKDDSGEEGDFDDKGEDDGEESSEDDVSESDEPLEDYKSGDEGDDEETGVPVRCFEEIDIIKFGNVSSLEGEMCACISPVDKASALMLMSEMLDLEPNLNNINCMIDNMIRSYNLIFNHDSGKEVDATKIAFADLFYRLRHEILFKLVCLSLNLPVQHSDIPFKQFGIESERTPDLIVIKEGGLMIIIEITVTSSLERAAVNKGMEQFGFESKYKLEIDMLNDKGIANIYAPIFFDMSNLTHPLYQDQFDLLTKHFNLNQQFKVVMDIASREIAILTSNIKYDLVLPSSILFTPVMKITANHENLDFLYRRSSEPIKLNNYEELVVSPQVYRKILTDRSRLYWLLDHNSFPLDSKLIFVLNTISHRVSLEKDCSGLPIENLRDILNSSDISVILRFVKIKMGNVLKESTVSDSGVKFYERVKEHNTLNRTQAFIPTVCNHEPRLKRGEFEVQAYHTKLKDFSSRNYHSLHYDPNYEDLLIESITNYDSNSDYSDIPVKNLLGNLKSNSIDIDEVMVPIRESYIESNLTLDSVPLKKLKMKSPFLLPLVDLNSTSYCPLDNKNTNFIESIIKNIEDENPYSSLILQNTLNDNYKFYSAPKLMSRDLTGLISERMKLSNEINVLQKALYRKGSKDGQVQLSKTKDPEFESKFNEIRSRFKVINKEIETRKKRENIGKHISYVRLPTKGRNSNLRSLYEREMTHFKRKNLQSTIEGVGIINNLDDDYTSDYEIYQNITEMLTENRGKNPDSILHDYVSDDAQLLSDLKKAALDNYRQLLHEIQNSALGHAASFVSRLAHTVMYFSQLPFNSDYIRVDNLGYKNCLVMIKGGKKIFKSKSSKIFRIIYPISDKVLPWYVEGHKDKGSFRYFKHDGTIYGITPWIMLHESILTDSISFYPRVISFTLLNLNNKIPFRLQFNTVSFNILLAFHNRRHTEVILANMRYILLSTLGDFTGVQLILPEFFGFNYDRFQSFVRNSILINYPNYFKQLQKLKDTRVTNNKEISLSDFEECRLRNIFTLDVISNTENLALMIYSTFLMTKAPYQRVAERARNLRGILEIHETFDKEVGLSLDPEEQFHSIAVENKGSLSDYAKRLFRSDFCFDPKFCANVGCFINSIYKTQGDSDDIHAAWIRILNQSWDEMATSTGLRGDYNDTENFWGQKGYFVIYKNILNKPGYRERLFTILTGESNDDVKRKELRNLNETFSELTDKESDFLIFHAVDKVQWRGGREIYVMDINTKLKQQPIEKFMAYLCQKLDNELISIPSDRRAQVIHHAIFEKDLPLKEMLTWYLTLDCSKWAPKSVFIKFVVTILNMDVIPTSFKTHFMNYIDKLYYKRIYFNEAEVSALTQNSKYKNLCDKYLVKDTKVGGFYMLMPYSWVMGIFNYTSSFLHAANQKYVSHLLMKTTLISFKEEASLVMFAHSDDSGGRLSVADKSQAGRCLVLYEIFLKSCNHLISKKKSVVSRIYFEILSVIYLFKKLLALLPKFLGGLRFLPTDKGPSQDMLQSYSKSIEVMVAGSDFSVAYLVMKVYSFLVWRFYYNREPTDLDYRRPVQYLGLPDAHPLFVLLCGSDADTLRLIRNKENLAEQISFVNAFSKSIDSEGPIKPLLFEIKVKGIKRGFEDSIELFKDALDKWSVRNVNFHNTGMNCLSFLRKLNDSGFVGSLVNESTVRRISRSYFIRTGNSSVTRFGNVRLNDTLDSISLCQSYSNPGGAAEQLLNEILDKDQIHDINDAVNSGIGEAYKVIGLLHETLRSPLNIYKYLEYLSLQNRKIENINRTLKPTQIQLVRSTRVFSTDFDPATLVSYIKEPEFRWALPNVRGLFTSSVELEAFMKKTGFKVEETSPDMLLRVCRTYGRESVKNIYVYSRVPSDIRQIRSYTAFLSFLSVNSFSGKEITGLTMKLGPKETGKDYLQTQLSEEVYLVNNLISLLLTLTKKCGHSFVKGLTIKDVPEIGFKRGNVLELLNHIDKTKTTDVRYTLMEVQLNCLRYELGVSESRHDIVKGAYYTYLKSQKSRKGWFGEGELYISLGSNFYSLIINNTEVTSIYTNKVGKLPQHHFEYITDVCNQNDINFNKFKKVKPMNYNNYHYGLDHAGEASVLRGREIETGIPCILLDKRNDFVDRLDSFEYDHMQGDYIIIKSGFMDQYIYKKIYFLPIKTVTMITTIKMYLDERDFESKLLESGLGEFEEFIYTEILTEYGKDLYIDFNDFLDNYLGSKLYDIFKKTFDNSYSKFSKTPEFSPLPASEGSLVRILIDYSSYTKDLMIKTPLNLNPSIMQVRSEYPEKMATLLGEKLAEYHEQIYNSVEKKEIEDSYTQVSYSENDSDTRNTIIKLMTYWGYGSLVNSINNFTMVKEPKNFLYFNKSNLIEQNMPYFSNLHVEVTKILLKLEKKWEPIFRGLDTPLESIYRITDRTSWVTDHAYSTIMSVYNHVNYKLRSSLSSLIFANTFLGYLKDDNFAADLQYEFSKNYILSTLPISWANRFDLLAVLNVLASVWVKSNSQDYELDYSVKIQRLPDNIPSYRSFVREFGLDLGAGLTHYHGFINETFISYFYTLQRQVVSGKEFRISFRLNKKSQVNVPVSPLFIYKRPLKEEILESDLFQDIQCELEMGDLDVDTINDLFDELKEMDIYKSKTTKAMKNNVVRATVHLVIEPFNSSGYKILNNLNNVGENFIWITDEVNPDFTKVFKNSGVKLLNLSKKLKNRVRPMLAYYSFVKELSDKDFIKKLLPFPDFDPAQPQLKLVKDNIVRNIDGNLCYPHNMGLNFTGDIFSGGKVLVVKDGFTTVEENTKEAEEPQKVECSPGLSDREKMELDKILEVENHIAKIEEEGVISKEHIINLRRKYKEKISGKGLPLIVIMNSLVRETELIKLNADIMNNKAGIGADDQKKMFLSPNYFGLAKGLNRSEINPIKDKRLRSEINSFGEDMASLIGSNTLKMSFKTQKLLVANFKMWVRMVKTGKFKSENKNFLLTVLITLINNSFVSEDESDDMLWQGIINKTTMYISDEGPESDDDDELIDLLFETVPMSRLKYRPLGT